MTHFTRVKEEVRNSESASSPNWRWLLLLLIPLVGFLGCDNGRLSEKAFDVSQDEIKSLRAKSETDNAKCRDEAKSFQAKYETDIAKWRDGYLVMEGKLESANQEILRLNELVADCCNKKKQPKVVVKPKAKKTITKQKSPEVYVPAPQPTPQPKALVDPPCPTGNCSKFAWDPSDPRQPRPGTISPRY